MAMPRSMKARNRQRALDAILTWLEDSLGRRVTPTLTGIGKLIDRLINQETVVVPALVVAVSALILTLIPAISAPFVHLLALTGMIMGMIAWIRRENRLLCVAVIVLSGLALAWRYMLWLIVLLVAVIWYSVRRDRPRRKKRS